MMRRLLLLILIFHFSAGILNAQCVPDTSTIPGITPDSATGLAAGNVGSPYSQILQVRVPTDTTVELSPGFPVTVTIVSIQVNSFTGLPPGLTYSCNPSSCIFPGGSNGCVEISGTPTTAGVYPLTAIVTTSGSLGGFPILQTDTITYYVITVNGATGIAEYNTQGFALSQNTPNPFSEVTNITFLSPLQTEIEFRIFNMIGKEVHVRNISADAGINTLRLDSRDFSPGVYMYSITLAGKTLSHRMVVTRK